MRPSFSCAATNSWVAKAAISERSPASTVARQDLREDVPRPSPTQPRSFRHSAAVPCPFRRRRCRRAGTAGGRSRRDRRSRVTSKSSMPVALSVTYAASCPQAIITAARPFAACDEPVLRAEARETDRVALLDRDQRFGRRARAASTSSGAGRSRRRRRAAAAFDHRPRVGALLDVLAVDVAFLRAGPRRELLGAQIRGSCRHVDADRVARREDEADDQASAEDFGPQRDEPAVARGRPRRSRWRSSKLAPRPPPRARPPRRRRRRGSGSA